jgi:hypothetical protein
MPHASKMIRHINEFFKGKPTERRLQLLRDFADLMLLKLEADTTTRLLTAAGPDAQAAKAKADTARYKRQAPLRQANLHET